MNIIHINMNNITYNITENNTTENNTTENNTTENYTTKNYTTENNTNIFSESPYINKNVISTVNENEKYARIMDYDLNYTIKYLTIILESYGMKKNKLNKQKIIEKIVDFEMDINNYHIIDENKQLLENLIKLKNNQYFSKYILI